jgi:citrate synthase
VFAEVSALDSALLDRTPMEAKRALISRLEDGDDATLALRLTAAPAVFTAAVIRAQAGLAPIEPDPDLGHAAVVLRMVRGTPATEPERAALDAYLVTVADHGLNAPSRHGWRPPHGRA